ncbi:MAG: TrlF family AAA-like ATPase [Acidobacteriota bacterium]
MTLSPGEHPGATWRRVDLQVHSIRDPNWKGRRFEGREVTDLEQARKEWSEKFVLECRAIGLSAIALTDHHDVCMIPYVVDAIKRLNLEEDLWLFPGIEVTCDDACQALVIFDVGVEPARLHRLLGKLKKVDQIGDDQLVASPASNAGLRVEELVDEIGLDAVLDPICVVVPHAGGDGAHKSVLRREFHSRFRNLNCVGFYVETAFSRLSQSARRKIYGEDKEWGGRRRGLVVTGDNRRADFSDLGVNPCWIRLGEPTAESLRQAFLADEARIRFERPTVPSQRVLAVRVDSTLTCLTGITFNDGFTAIIGGRGSGKSSLLEFLRFGLGRSSLDVPGESPEKSRLKSLLETTLANGYVEVDLDRDGVFETWRRTLRDRETIQVQVAEEPKEEISVPVAQERFRARAYEQKELSTIKPSRLDAMRQVSSIAAAELWEKRHAVEASVEEHRRSIRRILGKVVDLWALESGRNVVAARYRDLRRRLKSISDQLVQQGVSEADSEILSRAQYFLRGGSLLAELRADLVGLGRQVDDLVKRVSSVSIGTGDIPDDQDFEIIKSIAREVTNSKEAVKNSLEDAGRILDELTQGLNSGAQRFEILKSAFEGHRKAAGQRQAGLARLVDEQAKLQKALEDAEREGKEVRGRIAKLGGAGEELLAAREALSSEFAKRRTVLSEAAAKTSDVSEGVLRATVVSPDVPRAYSEALKGLLAGAMVHDLEFKVDEWTRRLVERDEWQALGNRLLRLFRLHVVEGDQRGAVDVRVLQECLGANLSGLTERQVEQMFLRMSEEKVVAVLAADPREVVEFEYLDGDAYIQFEAASPGQQAGALLQLLLIQEAGTLIVDQPEEDLDSGVIMRIVSLLRKTKQKRQVIFATHNPNVVVNGDADKVIALRSSVLAGGDGGVPRVSVWVDGALETPRLRSAVVEIMDGGQAAFELRRAKYRF